MAEEKNVLLVYDSDTSGRVGKILERIVRNDFPSVRPEAIPGRSEALRMMGLKRYDVVYIADTMLDDPFELEVPPEMYIGLEREGAFLTGTRERDYCAASRHIVRGAIERGIPVVVGDELPSFYNDILVDVDGAKTLSSELDSPVRHYEAIIAALDGR